MPHVFEPFFTTKPVGVGTGLGLPICHRIVTSMNGTIAVESEVGRGTVFRVFLPTSMRAVAEPEVHASRPTPRATGARVLVVDDDAMVGVALSRLLAPDHHVTALTAARAACERIVRGERYDVIFCNVMMPLMTGADFHAELTQAAPEQAARIVFMTGGAFTPAAREFLDRTQAPKLEKPFDTLAVHSVIERFVS
jgi:CheY-like chemotaxis protein